MTLRPGTPRNRRKGQLKGSAVTSKVRKPRVADPDSGQEKQPVIITVTDQAVTPKSTARIEMSKAEPGSEEEITISTEPWRNEPMFIR